MEEPRSDTRLFWKRLGCCCRSLRESAAAPSAIGVKGLQQTMVIPKIGLKNKGRYVLLGFGAIGQSLVDVLRRYSDIEWGQFLIVDKVSLFEKPWDGPMPRGLYVQTELNKENLLGSLEKLVCAGDTVINLSDLDSGTAASVCHMLSLNYIDSHSGCLEFLCNHSAPQPSTAEFRRFGLAFDSQVSNFDYDRQRYSLSSLSSKYFESLDLGSRKEFFLPVHGKQSCYQRSLTQFFGASTWPDRREGLEPRSMVKLVSNGGFEFGSWVVQNDGAARWSGFYQDISRVRTISERSNCLTLSFAAGILIQLLWIECGRPTGKLEAFFKEFAPFFGETVVYQFENFFDA